VLVTNELNLGQIQRVSLGVDGSYYSDPYAYNEDPQTSPEQFLYMDKEDGGEKERRKMMTKREKMRKKK